MIEAIGVKSTRVCRVCRVCVVSVSDLVMAGVERGEEAGLRSMAKPFIYTSLADLAR